LSAVLINTVEKILAAGPLPEPAPPSPSPSESSSSGLTVSTPPHDLSTNGHGAAPNEPLPIEPSSPDTPSAPTALLVFAPSTETAPTKPRWIPTPPPAAIAAELREATVTLTLEVVSAESTVDFRTDALQLKLSHQTVAVTMDSADSWPEASTEVDFELGAFTLRADGKIDTLRITPTPQSSQLANSQTELANDHEPSESNEAGGRAELPPEQRHHAQMRVRLSAYFNVLRVELSPNFQL
ncbi:MAG: hypothetical protein ACREF8_06310, partial [Chthoniobacterales bacterium]